MANAKNNLVSVVVPAFNAERTISTMIESVLSQTYSNFELIICDDASTDKTTSVVASFADDRIHLITHAHKLGPGPSRDHAIAEAHGQWIAMLDADDAFAPARLQILINAASAYPDDLIIDNTVDCHDSPCGLVPWRSVWSKNTFHGDERDIRELSFVELMVADRLLFKPFLRRDLISQHRATHGFKANGEDMAFALCLFSHGVKVRYVSAPMYLYRMTPGSVSTTTPHKHKLYREVFEEAREQFAWDPDALRAIDARIARIRKMETYQYFFSATMEARLGNMLQLALKHPWVVTEFMARILRRIPFHIHRVLHHGARREIR